VFVVKTSKIGLNREEIKIGFQLECAFGGLFPASSGDEWQMIRMSGGHGELLRNFINY
jgi:hypothetical protein